MELEFVTTADGGCRIKQIKKHFFELKALLNGSKISIKSPCRFEKGTYRFKVSKTNKDVFNKLALAGFGYIQGEAELIKATATPIPQPQVIFEKKPESKPLPDTIEGEEVTVTATDETQLEGEYDPAATDLETVAGLEALAKSEAEEIVEDKSDEKDNSLDKPINETIDSVEFQFTPVEEEPETKEESGINKFADRALKVTAVAAAGWLIYRTVKYFSQEG